MESRITSFANQLTRVIKRANDRVLSDQEKKAIVALKVALADKARDDEAAHR